MPEYSRIFGPTDDLVVHMIAEPLILEHLFDLGCDDDFIVPPPKGLLVVRVPDDWWMTHGDVRHLGPGVLEIRAERVAANPPGFVFRVIPALRSWTMSNFVSAFDGSLM